MRSTTTTVIAATGIAIGIALGGCAQSRTAPSSPGESNRVAAAGAAAMRAVSVLESPTISVALDRIDQREPELDNRYHRRGTGAGVTVYVFDGGIAEDHPELAGRVRRGFSAFPDEEPVCNAHGTAVAGAIGGQTLGVAPGVEIVDVKMVECRRMRGTIAGIVEATEWVIADVRANPRRRAVANWSFVADTGTFVPALDSAVAALVAAGVPVVVSAGNIDMNACRISPANAPRSISVGASAYMRDPDGMVADRRAPGTAHGPCIDVYAPGDSVMLPGFTAARQHNTQLWNGTSMSAGYVSGAAALFLEAHPAATPTDVAEWLRETGTRNVVSDTRSRSSRMLFVGANGQAR